MPANKEGNVVCHIGVKPTAQFNGSPWTHYGPYCNEEEAAKALRKQGWRYIKGWNWWVTDEEKYLTAEIQTVRPKPRNLLPRAY